MKTLRRLLFLLYKVINYINFKLNRVTGLYPAVDGLVTIFNKGVLSFGEGSRINSSKYKNVIGGDTRSSIVVRKGASLQIGSNFKMSNSAIYCAQRIIIGNNVMIGGSCKIWDTDFHPLDSNERKLNPNENFQTDPITIEDNVFIGGFSIILKGVTIGEGSIIGAGSIVTKSVPPGEIWAGNPARFIKKISTLS